MQVLRVFCTTAGLAAALACTACQSRLPAEVKDEQLPVPPKAERKVYPIAYEITRYPRTVDDYGTAVAVLGDPGEITVPGNGAIAAVLRWEGIPEDMSTAPPVKFELDFGDTLTKWLPGEQPRNGWHDVTALAANFDLDPEDGIDFNRIAKHLYWDGPGKQSRLRGRVTFADGEVVESRVEDEPRILFGNMNPEPLNDHYHYRGLVMPSWTHWNGATFKPRSELPWDAPAPLRIGFTITPEMYWGWDAKPFKYEVDWGDGSGWVDITADSAVWGGGRDTIAEDKLTTYTYLVPGTYSVNVRATYWDGEIVYTRVPRTVIVR